MQTDPVCGMQVDEQSAVAQSVFKDKTYVFVPGAAKINLNSHRRNF